MLMHFIMIKSEIENVEVVSSVDCPHHWHSVDEMMRKFVTVALNNAVNRARWNIFY